MGAIGRGERRLNGGVPALHGAGLEGIGEARIGRKLQRAVIRCAEDFAAWGDEHRIGEFGQPMPTRARHHDDLDRGVGGLEGLNGDHLPIVLDPEAGGEQVGADLGGAHAGEPGAVELDRAGLPVHAANRDPQSVCSLLVHGPEASGHAERGRDRQPDLVLVLVLAGIPVDHDLARLGVLVGAGARSPWHGSG